MDIGHYLQRIKFVSMLEPTANSLHTLQLAHMQAVQFENLDIVPLHRPIVLDLDALWDKIVVRRRGGFCYELNGLFAYLLRELGFRVTYLNARVFRRDGSLGIDFDHLALLVTDPSEGTEWLADVGFGDSFGKPLPLLNGEQEDGLRAYKLETMGQGYVAWQRNYDFKWNRMYYFDLTPHSFPDEYESACSFHQHSPESSFTRQSIVSRATPDGRVSLEERRLIVTHNGLRSEREIAQEEWPRLLNELFDVVL
jgi:N-hydroxyarylamine O-acetyltransferase